MFFSAIPTPGSSGGPIVDLESGSVVGVIRGSRLDNRVAGLRGWATSSESIYEVSIHWPDIAILTQLLDVYAAGYKYR
jgi:hypothetical protein